jgi:glycerol-3-phosphate acyltransferase PlsX
MGGDHAPLMVLQGLEIAAVRHPGARFLLVGDEAQLNPLLQQHRRAAAVCDIRHAPEAISNDTKPTAALRVRGSSCASRSTPQRGEASQM